MIFAYLIITVKGLVIHFMPGSVSYQNQKLPHCSHEDFKVFMEGFFGPSSLIPYIRQSALSKWKNIKEKIINFTQKIKDSQNNLILFGKEDCSHQLFSLCLQQFKDLQLNKGLSKSLTRKSTVCQKDTCVDLIFIDSHFLVDFQQIKNLMEQSSLNENVKILVSNSPFSIRQSWPQDSPFYWPQIFMDQISHILAGQRVIIISKGCSQTVINQNEICLSGFKKVLSNLFFGSSSFNDLYLNISGNKVQINIKQNWQQFQIRPLQIRMIELDNKVYLFLNVMVILLLNACLMICVFNYPLKKKAKQKIQ